MMYCFKCGFQNDDRVPVCNRCGAIIATTANRESRSPFSSLSLIVGAFAVGMTIGCGLLVVERHRHSRALQEIMAQKESEVGQLKRQVETVENGNSNKLALVDQLREENKNLKAQIAAQRAALQDKDNALSKNESEINRLKRQLANTDSLDSTLDKLRAENKRLESQVEAQRAALKEKDNENSYLRQGMNGLKNESPVQVWQFDPSGNIYRVY